MTANYSAVRTIAAPAAEIFAVLADPVRHSRLDPLEMVLRPVTSEPIERVGQVFSMNMVYENGEQVEHYRTDNHVVVCESPTAIGWATAPVGEPPPGWIWRYDLTAVDRDTTEVRLSYDWSDASAENVRRFGVPMVGPDDLAVTLERLADQVG